MKVTNFNAFIVVCCFVFLFSFSSNAVTHSMLYGGTDHEEAVSVKSTADGGAIVAGNSRSFGPETQVWILKLDMSGKVDWQKTYTNAEKESYSVNAVDLIPDRGLILGGTAMTCYEIDGNHCQTYGWMVKLDADGEVVWQKGYKDIAGNGSDFLAVQVTVDNGFIAAGRCNTLGEVTPRSRLWVVKTDADGAVQWQKSYHNENISDSYAYSVQQTQDEGYIVAGTLFSGITDWSDGYDVWVLKLDANGEVEWHAMYRGAGGFDIGRSVLQTSDGEYIVGGQTEDTKGYGTDGLVMKLDAEGNIKWQRNYETNTGDFINHIYQMSDGGYMAGGLYQAGGIALKLDQSGIIEWQKQYQSNFIISMSAAPNGVTMVTGGSSNREGITSNDILLLKTDETGSISTCLSVTDADVQIYDAALTRDDFTLTIASPDLRIINTLTRVSVTAVTPVEVCPYKTLELVSSTQAYVISSPEGILCEGKSCSGLYPGGDIVLLTIYPESEAPFIAWGGDCTGCVSEETSCNIYMDKDKTCTAIFKALAGDINGDGITGLKDAILALQSITGIDVMINVGYGLSGVDVNDNGILDLAEVIYALQREAEN